MKKKLVFLEFNEINFEFLDAYIARGKLPAFAKFFRDHGYTTTTSETEYHRLEPWIQWVTAHTGKSHAEHGVFRLGDIVEHDHPQIWEQLEALGFRVGAISPMNAKCRARAPAFFVPDPWTSTGIVAEPVFERLYRAIVQGVNDNAASRLTLRSAIDLVIGGARAASASNYIKYIRYLFNSKRKPWHRAMFLDLLLADLFFRSVRRTDPDFASLFLNAGAHIQHHYLFSSVVYKGNVKNPDWYIKDGNDPLLDVYELYDHVLENVRRQFPDARVMFATGLHQDPHPELTYYWRLRDHAAFLQSAGIEFTSVEPRMSRDFFIRCANAQSAHAAAVRLEQAIADDGTALFEVDNRGTDLFVMLTYPHDIPADRKFSFADTIPRFLLPSVAFVAIKNGRHNGVGYFADSGAAFPVPQFELKDMPNVITSALTNHERENGAHRLGRRLMSAEPQPC